MPYVQCVLHIGYLTHFGHQNIIEYTGRPWTTAFEMDMALIENWNNTVAPDDEVWFLGDFTLGHKTDEVQTILRLLNGRIHALLGNHDERTIARKSSLYTGNDMFEDVYVGIVEEKINGQRIVMSHYALETWNHQGHGAWMLHGHSHGSLPRSSQRKLDVGVDSVAPLLGGGAAAYRPISFGEIGVIMNTVDPRPVDHHTNVR